jgi:hypothetical protein
MNLTTGSIVSFTPAAPGTNIKFFPHPVPGSPADPWGDLNAIVCPVIGWAVVVSSANDQTTTALVPTYLYDGTAQILSTVPDPELAYRILPPAEATVCTGRHLPRWCGNCGTPETDPNPSGMSGRWRYRDGEPCPDCHPGHVHAPTGE